MFMSGYENVIDSVLTMILCTCFLPEKYVVPFSHLWLSVN